MGSRSRATRLSALRLGLLHELGQVILPYGGGGVRAVCEAVGIRDILAKSMGSSNHANVVKATLKALSQLRTRDQVLSARGKKKREKAI